MNTMSFENKLNEIRKLLAEAYKHYFSRDDWHCKSTEGAISIRYPPFFWSYNSHKEPIIEIYSYALGPNRLHEFNNIDDALMAVRDWHRKEMEMDYETATLQEIQTVCHCGWPAITGESSHWPYRKGMCEYCADVRCDAYPGECRKDS